MRNIFRSNKETVGVNQPIVDNTTKPPMSSGMPKMENPPPPPLNIPDKYWKAFKANSQSEAVNFMNDNNIEPKFIFGSSSGQINIFYKA